MSEDFLVERINDFQRIEQFLKQYEESSLFLLSNLYEYGTSEAEHLNSGDYYAIYSKGLLRGIFSLTKRGNILFQTGDFDLDPIPLYHYINEKTSLRLRGCLGSPKISKDFFDQLTRKGLKETYRSSEVLYSINLLEVEEAKTQAIDLESNHFQEWLELQRSFSFEVGLESNIEESYYRDLFEQKCNSVGVSGLIIEDELVSCAHLNAEVQNICQVGGVFTKPSFRRKGLSKQCMLHLMHRSQKHKFSKMILFTGDQNLHAQGLYKSLGFDQIGRYGLYMGE